MTQNTIPSEDYWPGPLAQIPRENPLEQNPVVVAEISSPWGRNSYRHLYTALVPSEAVEKIINHHGCIGTEVKTSGPHPSWPRTGPYRPLFWISGGDVLPENLEPLVVAWSTGSRTVLSPDQGFLMTYGLVPHAVKSDEADEIHWDDPGTPRNDVVIVKMVHKYRFRPRSEARVLVDRDYLQDYATIRDRALIQVYYASNQGPPTNDAEKALNGESCRQFPMRGRLVTIQTAPLEPSHILAQMWGTRRLLEPKDSPVTLGQWDHGTLSWPGIDQPVTSDLGHLGMRGMEFVYVQDDILKEYEGDDRYEIFPETGSVHYENQWIVSCWARVGRDLLMLHLKDLYEGVPPHVTNLWNNYAVTPPSGAPKITRGPNAATRSKRIVFGLVHLGECLAGVFNRASPSKRVPKDFVSLDRNELQATDWWKDKNIYAITWHIPVALRESEFLDRCTKLNKLVIEGLKESALRSLLRVILVPEDQIKDLHSLKLLDVLLQDAIISEETGLSLYSDVEDIEKRRAEKESRLPAGEHLETPIGFLFLLNDLRTADSHRTDRPLDDLLARLGTSRASVASGWGHSLDHVYDKVALALEAASETLTSIA